MPSFLACIRDKIGIVWSMKSTTGRDRCQNNVTLSTKTKQNHSQLKTVPSFSVKGLTRISMSQNKQCLSSIHTGMEVHLLIFFLKKQIIEIFCLFWIKRNYIMRQVCNNEMSLSKEILIWLELKIETSMLMVFVHLLWRSKGTILFLIDSQQVCGKTK